MSDMLLLLENMAVLPVKEFLDDEKNENAYECIDAKSQWFYAFFKYFWKKMQEGITY